jgi:hypothetical protein
MTGPTHRPQPADLAFAPPHYPAPSLDAPGLVATVRLGRPVGFVVRQGEALAWWGLYRDDEAPEEETVRRMAHEALRDAAARGDTADEAWAAVLALVLHDPPTEVARLATVAALLR